MKYLALAVSLFAWNLALAETDDFERCTRISDQQSRLQCFDNVAEMLWSADSSSADSAGEWDISVEVSPIDDSQKATAILLSKGTYRGTIGTPTHAALVMRCQEGRTDFYINWSVFLGTDDIRVVERIDSNEAQTRRWSISTDHKATFAPGNRVNYIKGLLDASQIVYRLTPYSENPITVTFDLAGINEAVAPVRNACDW